MVDVDGMMAAANRAATRELAKVEKQALQTLYESNGRGGLGSSSHVLLELELCVTGFRSICEAAVSVVAEVEHERAPQFAERLRAPLLVHQLAVDRIFQSHAAPGDSSPTMRSFVAQQLTTFHSRLDEALEGTLDDLKVGIAGGKSVASRKPADGVQLDLGGGAAQVMVNSPGGRQSVSGDMIGLQGVDVKELLTVLSGLRAEISSLPADDRDVIEDAIINVEREIAAPVPQASRLKRLTGVVGDVALRIGTGAAGGFLARLAAMAAGMA